MSNNTGVLKAELFSLDKQAETLERIVYSALCALESLPDDEGDKYEARILRKLERLDELQEQIDATVAKLKEAGAWSPVSCSAKTRLATAPRIAAPTFQKKRRPAAERKPVGPPKFVKERGTRQTRLIRSSLWKDACQVMDSEDGSFTVKELMKLTGQSIDAAKGSIQRWRNAGLITSADKASGIYSRIPENASQ
jgi:hypothetical protein